MITPPLRRARTLAVLAFAAIASSAFAHNLDTTSTALQYSPDFIETMKTRAAAGQSLIQPGDEFWVSMKTKCFHERSDDLDGYELQQCRHSFCCDQ